ncbi:hypothetical protein SASPL_121166 [Salvia splendens]|uniref:Uncharacterized protein n=1 Tax=Salvia splendens TaxID=180675 RepID=A0A8X8XUD3_SALSN|nr:hypothetical protein SASPL_121166 [Salvia splendens]
MASLDVSPLGVRVCWVNYRTWKRWWCSGLVILLGKRSSPPSLFPAQSFDQNPSTNSHPVSDY